MRPPSARTPTSVISLIRDGGTRRRKGSPLDRDGGTHPLKNIFKDRDVDTHLPRPLKARVGDTHPDTTLDLWHRGTPRPGPAEAREVPLGEVALQEDVAEA